MTALHGIVAAAPVSTASGGTGGSCGEVAWLAGLGVMNAALAESERRLLAEAAIAIDRDVRATGYALSIVDQMPRFAAILGSVGKFVPNAFNAAVKPAPHGEAVGLVLRNPAGEVVATHGMRLYRLGRRSLADHLSTLTLFYDRPIEQMPPGEYLWLEDDARRYAETVEDQATWSGGLWARPDHRSRVSNITTVLVLASRILTTLRWGRTVVFSVTGDLWTKPNAAARIKMPDVYERLKWWRPQLPAAERDKAKRMLLVVTEPEVPFERAARFLAGEDRLWIGVPQGVADGRRLAEAASG